MSVPTLNLHNIIKIQILKKKFNAFKIVQYGFKDLNGTVFFVEAFSEDNEYPEIEELPEQDVTTFKEATE